MKKVNLEKNLDKDTFHTICDCVEIAEKSKTEIYLVGGIVRDILLKKPLKDVDITIVGDVKNFVNCLKENLEIKNAEFDKNLPTAKVVFKNGTEIDFASTRKELYGKFGELPTVTETGCPLKEDIIRRDFTVNSIAISLNKKNLFEITDYLNGLEDLKEKKLRILHEKSFYDDASRIVRGLKFSERLNFKPDDKTMELQNEYLKNPIKDIPLTRVKKEIKDLFSLNKSSCFDNFVRQKIYKIYLSENFKCKLNGKRIKKVSETFCIKDEDVWLLYFLPFFLHENPLPKFNLTARELKIIKEIQNFEKDKFKITDKFSVYEYFINKDYLTSVFWGMLYNLNITKTFFKIKDIKIETTGEDLIKLEIPQGKIYSEIQRQLLKEKINKKIKNKDDEILYIKKHYSAK